MSNNREIILNNKTRIKISLGINIVGFILSIMAGWIDTIGVKLFLNESPSFMTGRVKALGYHAFNLDLKAFLGIALVILAFIMGAFMATIVTRKTGLRGGLVFTGILVIIASFPICLKHAAINTILIPMAMGCQNATTSLTPISRTTHLTGPATDIGINLAKRNWKMVMFWACRWIGFSLGTVIGFNLVSMVDKGAIHISTILIIPAIIIMLTGIIQKIVFDIPLLESILNIDLE